MLMTETLSRTPSPGARAPRPNQRKQRRDDHSWMFRHPVALPVLKDHPELGTLAQSIKLELVGLQERCSFPFRFDYRLPKGRITLLTGTLYRLVNEWEDERVDWFRAVLDPATDPDIVRQLLFTSRRRVASELDDAPPEDLSAPDTSQLFRERIVSGRHEVVDRETGCVLVTYEYMLGDPHVVQVA